MFHQNGLLERLHRQYVPDIGPCSVNHGKISKPVALNLKMLWPLFTLLIVGLALSFILFVFSLCRNRRGARVKPQVPAGP
jgi:hypothetical protein